MHRVTWTVRANIENCYITVTATSADVLVPGRTYQRKFLVILMDVRNGKFLSAGDRFCGNGDALGHWRLLRAE